MNSVSVERDVLATACGDGKVRTWSLVTLECTRTFEAHDGWVYTVRLLGGVLVSGGSDRRVRVWGLAAGGECVATLEHTACVNGLAVLPTGAVAAAGHHNENASGVRVWRPRQ